MLIDSIVIDTEYMVRLDLSRLEQCGEKDSYEQRPSIGSMYVFIEFGRLGCKHVIYLGDVYVHDFINVLHLHTV
jgi:hypothetical protein